MLTRAGVRNLSAISLSLKSLRAPGPDWKPMLRGMRCGITPTSPAAPAVRSWANRPMTGPAAASLKELSRLGMTVMTSARVMA